MSVAFASPSQTVAADVGGGVQFLGTNMRPLNWIDSDGMKAPEVCWNGGKVMENPSQIT